MAKSFEDWENHFGDYSFCESDIGATQADLDLFNSQTTVPDVKKFPNFARWYKTIKASAGGSKNITEFRFFQRCFYQEI